MVTNAPERIFAGYHHVHGHQKVWDTKSIGENGWQNVTEYIRADKVAALVEAAYLAGFNSSGEGYNGEYPFDHKGINHESDARWIAERDRALAAFKGDTTHGD